MHMYPGCGFPVALLSGVAEHVIEGRVTKSYADLAGLHAAIADCIISARWPMTPPEFRFLRRESGRTQRDLAELFDVDPQTVSNWERGESGIPWSVDVALRAFSGRSVENLAIEALLRSFHEGGRPAAYQMRFTRVNDSWLEVSEKKAGLHAAYAAVYTVAYRPAVRLEYAQATRQWQEIRRGNEFVVNLELPRRNDEHGFGGLLAVAG
jgi:transcriptional regulator with XRE-family HTH domain